VSGRMTCLVLALVATPCWADPPIPDEWNRLIADRLSAARATEFALALPAGSNPDLLLLNRFAEEIEVSLERQFEDNQPSLTETLVLKPRQPRRLKAPVRQTPGPLVSSVILLKLEGDVNMLQAWGIFGGSTNPFEAPFSPIDRQADSFTRLAVFGPIDGLVPKSFRREVVVFNSNEHTVTLGVTSRNADGLALASFSAAIPGRGSRRILLDSVDVASIYLESDARGGSLIANGFLVDPSGPWQALTVIDRNAALDTNFSSFSAPPGATGWLTAHNSSETIAQIEIRNEVAASASDFLMLPPNATRTVLLPEGSRRFQVVSAGPGVSVSAHRWQNAALVDTAVISHKNAHDSGTYALDNLLESGATLEILNLGTEAATVLAYAEWHKGAYSFKPAKLPPGGSIELRLDAWARDPDNLGPDSLGRRFEPADHSVFLQWFSRPGGAKLLGRLTVQEDGADDSLGFNCFGCCEELPSGVVLPGSVVFDIGQTVGLETAEFIDSCAGRAGPFPIASQTRSYSAPLTWNGATASSSGVTRQTVGFTATGTYTWFSCSLRQRTVRGAGEAEVDQCQKTWNPGFDPQRGCPGMFAACTPCTACCGRELSVALCRCQKLPGATARESCERLARLASQQSCNNVCLANDPEGCN
jgi:hypothetical protein